MEIILETKYHNGTPFYYIVWLKDKNGNYYNFFNKFYDFVEAKQFMRLLEHLYNEVKDYGNQKSPE